MIKWVSKHCLPYLSTHQSSNVLKWSTWNSNVDIFPWEGAFFIGGSFGSEDDKYGYLYTRSLDEAITFADWLITYLQDNEDVERFIADYMTQARDWSRK